MKKGTKISLIVLACFVAILTAAFICADMIASHLVQREVNKALADLPGCEAECGTIHLRFFSGTAEVNNLAFSYRGEPIQKKDTVGPGVKIHVQEIEVGRLFYTLLLKKQILISDVRIKHPQVELWMDEEHPEKCFPELHDEGLEHMNQATVRADLMRLHINHADFKLHSLRTKLDVAAEDFNLLVTDLGYDSVFTYCDSVYDISLGHAAIMLPDGMIRLETNALEHKNQGAFRVGETRIANTMPRKKLGDMVKEPVTWMDMTISSVETSPLNPLRKALAKDFTLDKIKAVVASMDIYRDERYAPKKPFDMPQTILMAIPARFMIHHVDAHINAIDIQYASTNVNCGELHLKGIQAAVDNVTNKPGATMTAGGTCPIQEGKAEASFSMTMNKACDFGMKLHATDINANYLNTFLRPLVGITCELKLDDLNTEYTGNSEKATGTFRMLYHGLEVQVHEDDDIPYKIVTKNAKTFTTLANTLIPKSNPTIVDIHPRAYSVEWKRDVWKPFPLYLFGPCIDGAKETMLPGLYVHKQVRK